MGPGVPQPTLGAESLTDVAQCLQLLAEPKAWPPASGSMGQQPKTLTSSVPKPQRLEIQKPAPTTIACACLWGPEVFVYCLLYTKPVGEYCDSLSLQRLYASTRSIICSNTITIQAA